MTELEPPQKLWLTKTFWAQIGTLIASVLTMTGMTFGFDPAAFAATMLMLSSLVDTIIRAVTKRRVTL